MAAQRDKRGRFLKGNQVGRGNKGGRLPRKREERYYSILQRACSDDDWRTICDTAVARAKAGDKDARNWIAGYLIGRPEQHVDVSIAGSVAMMWPEDARAEDH